MKRDRSTKDTDDFIIYSVIVFSFIYLFYFYSFFTPYANQLRVSDFKAYTVITVSGFIGCLIVFRRQRHSITMAVSIAFPFCLFTLLNMSSIFRCSTTMIVLLVIAMAGVCLMVVRKDFTMSSEKEVKISKGTLKKCAVAAHMMFTLLMTFCVMTAVVSNVITFQKESKAIASFEEEPQTTKEINTYDLSKYTTENYNKELEGFADSKWAVLSEEERIRLLQIVANIEANTMGISKPFVVKSDNLNQEGKDIYTTGCYESKANSIIIDEKYLETEESYWVLQTLCHECYHGWQHSLVKLYFEAGEDSKQLRIFSDVRDYLIDIKSYDEALNNFDQYYNLKLESMARAYGEDRAKDYYLVSLRVNPSPSNKERWKYPEEKDRRFHYDYEEENYMDA